MDNNNSFGNGFYGSSPQKPFNDKSGSDSAQEQTSVQNENTAFTQPPRTAFEPQNVQYANTPSVQPNASDMFSNSEQNNTDSTASPSEPDTVQGVYSNNPNPAPQSADYGPVQHNDYSHPVYSNGAVPPQNRVPIQDNFGVQRGQYGGYNPQNSNAMPPQYGAYVPYPPMPVKPPKKKVSAGLVVIITVLCLLLVGSISGFCIYLVSNNNVSDPKGSFSFTTPEHNYTVPEIQSTTSPDSEHTESDYSDKVDPNFKGVSLENKPKDASTNKDYTAEYAFNKVSDSVVGVVGYSGEITSVENCESQGSGIIISSDGYVVTNAHVIGNSKTAYTLQIVTPDGKTYNAGVVGYDSRTDIAVLKMDDAKNLKAANFGDSEKIEIGEDIIVVGNSGGLDYQNSITKGIVSAVDRKMSSSSLVKYIQTDAAINPGNSGGPIVNLYGQVVGIATAKIVSEKYEGMGFAIPSASAKEIIDTLMKKGYVEGRVKIGITGTNVTSQDASAYGIPKGIMIDEILPDGPCYGTELKPEDIITAADGKTIASFSDIYEILEGKKPGDIIKLEYYRISDGSTGEVEVKLAEDK